MSGYPNPEDIAELRLSVEKLHALQMERTDLIPIIIKHQNRLKDIEHESAEAHNKIVGKMQKMDVASQGNYGWTNRFVSFLIEFNKQIRSSLEPTSPSFGADEKPE